MPKSKSKFKEYFSLTRTQQIMFGVFLVLFSIIIFSSLVSYFSTWRADQSELTEFFDKGVDSINIASKFGAIISHLLIYLMFGISSFIIPILLFISGLTLFVNADLSKLYKRWFWGILTMIWFSLFFGYYSTNYIYSGSIGFEVNEFLKIYIGDIGIISILIFGLLAYIVIRIKVTPELVFEFIKKLYPKVKKELIDENQTNSNELNLS